MKSTFSNDGNTTLILGSVQLVLLLTIIVWFSRSYVKIANLYRSVEAPDTILLLMVAVFLIFIIISLSSVLIGITVKRNPNSLKMLRVCKILKVLVIINFPLIIISIPLSVVLPLLNITSSL